MLYIIFAVVFLIGLLTAERCLYYGTRQGCEISAMRAAWQTESQKRPLSQLEALKALFLWRYRLSTQRISWLLRVLVAICPLLGLLGTVLGMIEVFESLSSQFKVLQASTIAMVVNAIIPTLAGMSASVVGLACLWMLGCYERRGERKARHALNPVG